MKVIDLSHNEKVIGISPSLECLKIESNFITDPSCLYTKDSKNHNELKSLNVSNNPIPYHQLILFLVPNYLVKLESLTMNNLIINESCLALQEFIVSSKNLQILSLQNCNLSQFSWINLIEGLKLNSSLR